MTLPDPSAPMAYVLLPCLNEEVALKGLLPALAQTFNDAGQPFHIVLVDDGSTDGTATVAAPWASADDLTVLRHPVNQGLGAAMQTGISHLVTTAKPDDVVVTMDADLTHPPALSLLMMAQLRAGADVVIASRYASGGEEVGLTLFRRFLSRMASLLLTVFFPLPGVRDYTCGYRAYRVATLQQANELWDGRLVEDVSFVCMAEILVKLGSMGARITEVGLRLRYDLKPGASKMKILRTIARYGALIRRRQQIRQRGSAQAP